ncbi:Protein NPG1 [Linum perenne]
MVESQSAESSGNEDQILVREFCSNGACVKAEELEAKLDNGNIEEVESSLREGLSLNLEANRSSTGRSRRMRRRREGR